MVRLCDSQLTHQADAEDAVQPEAESGSGGEAGDVLHQRAGEEADQGAQ